MLCSQIQRYLMQPVPVVLTVALVWDSSSASPSNVAALLQRVDLTMDLQRAFKGVAQPTPISLRGMYATPLQPRGQHAR